MPATRPAASRQEPVPAEKKERVLKSLPNGPPHSCPYIVEQADGKPLCTSESVLAQNGCGP